MFILFILFLLHFSIGFIGEVIKAKFITNIMSWLLLATVFVFTVGLRYTADYKMYSFLFTHEIGITDVGFKQLTILFKEHRLTYDDLFLTHIIVYTILYFIFIKRYTSNYFYVFLAFILIDYVHYANQIRYYLAFSLLLFAFHFMFKRRYLWMIICCILAFVSHSATIVLFTFIPIYFFIKTNNYFKFIFILSIACFAIVYLGFSLGFARQIEHFGEYFDKGGISGFAGGLFNSLPYIILVGFLYIQTKKYFKNNENWINDKKFIFLYKLSFYTVIFIPAAFFVQIAGHRYVMPFLTIYVIYFLYIIRDNPIRQKSHAILGFSTVCFIVSIFIYILPTYILKENHFVHELELMLESIKYLKYKQW
ncbi:EpsG family protein [Soonwooa sp.]|uniref:EpsG family protein n=1 Tax=Soonwooa sp. TaxID=1938592 RepID=UPI0028AA66CC|nr:EpsG family protein [Soonwooa sp.]